MNVSLVATRWDKVLAWTPRVLGLLFTAFLSLFALDVFDMGLGFWKTLAALLIHLIPSFVFLLASVLPRRWGWLSGLIFVAWGAWYVTAAHGEVVSTYLLVAGIPALIGLLFIAGWLRHRKAA